MKRKVLFLLAGMCLILTACGGENGKIPTKVEEFGEIQSTESEKDSEDSENKTVSLPYYDVSNLPMPQEYKETDVMEEKTSYYKMALSSRPKQTYDEIYNGATLMDSEVALSKTVTPAELENVMNIIFLDTPELFALDTAYGYQTNADGYVEKVYLSYIMSQEEMQEWKDELASQKPRILQQRLKNDHNTINAVLAYLFDNTKFRQAGLLEDGSYDYSPESLVLAGVRGGGANSLGMSKKISYWLRQCGINATLSAGELITPDRQLSDQPLVIDYAAYKTESVDEQGIYKVDLDYSSYWFWNLVELDGNWYNFDYMYSKLLFESDSQIGKTSLYFVPDLVLSQTRLSYVNEEILGISPSCIDKQYQEAYRNGNYVLSHSEVQMVMRLEQEIGAIDQENKKSVFYQFEDEQTFNFFLDKFDEQMAYYNETYGEPIGSYKLVPCRDALIIYVAEIINNF